jgi:hypothetical protein
MGTNLEERLKASQLKELQLISAMIAKGEPLATIDSMWESFVKKSKNELAALETGETTVDVNEVINQVLSEAYLEANNDLQIFAERVKFLNAMKKQIRDEIARTRKTLENYIDSLEEKLSSIGDDAQLANIDLQNLLQKQSRTIQMLSTLSKMLHDTAMAVIRKIGG